MKRQPKEHMDFLTSMRLPGWMLIFHTVFFYANPVSSEPFGYLDLHQTGSPMLRTHLLTRERRQIGSDSLRGLFKAPCFGRVGFFEDPFSCSHYFHCMINGTHVRKSCTPPLLFTEDRQMCTDPASADCPDLPDFLLAAAAVASANAAAHGNHGNPNPPIGPDGMGSGPSGGVNHQHVNAIPGTNPGPHHMAPLSGPPMPAAPPAPPNPFANNPVHFNRNPSAGERINVPVHNAVAPSPAVPWGGVAPHSNEVAVAGKARGYFGNKVGDTGNDAAMNGPPRNPFVNNLNAKQSSPLETVPQSNGQWLNGPPSMGALAAAISRRNWPMHPSSMGEPGVHHGSQRTSLEAMMQPLQFPPTIQSHNQQNLQVTFQREQPSFAHNQSPPLTLADVAPNLDPVAPIEIPAPPASVSSRDSSKCRPNQKGFFADRINGCRAYYFCSPFGDRAEFACPVGRFFSEETVSCQPHEQSSCAAGTSNTNPGLPPALPVAPPTLARNTPDFSQSIPGIDPILLMNLRALSQGQLQDRQLSSAFAPQAPQQSFSGSNTNSNGVFVPNYALPMAAAPSESHPKLDQQQKLQTSTEVPSEKAVVANATSPAAPSVPVSPQTRSAAEPAPSLESRLRSWKTTNFTQPEPVAASSNAIGKLEQYQSGQKLPDSIANSTVKYQAVWPSAASHWINPLRFVQSQRNINMKILAEILRGG